MSVVRCICLAEESICHVARLEALCKSQVAVVDGNRVMNIMCNLE